MLEFVASAAHEIDVQRGDLHLRARKGLPTGSGANPGPAAQGPSPEPATPVLSIISPLTGVVYLGPTPQAPAYVNVDDVVQVGQVVALIEAMKAFNEIRAEYGGRIVRILVRSSDLVQTGQPLLELADAQ